MISKGEHVGSSRATNIRDAWYLTTHQSETKG